MLNRNRCTQTEALVRVAAIRAVQRLVKTSARLAEIRRLGARSRADCLHGPDLRLRHQPIVVGGDMLKRLEAPDDRSRIAEPVFVRMGFV